MTADLAVLVMLVAVLTFPMSVLERLFPYILRITHDEIDGWRVHLERKP